MINTTLKVFPSNTRKKFTILRKGIMQLSMSMIRHVGRVGGNITRLSMIIIRIRIMFTITIHYVKIKNIRKR